MWTNLHIVEKGTKEDTRLQDTVVGYETEIVDKSSKIKQIL